MKMDYFKILLIFLIALPAQVFADISSGDGGYISQGVPNSEITLTAEEWAFLNSHDLRCAMAPNWSPINMYDQSKQLVGIAIDYWKLISKQLNINVDCAVKESYSEVLQAIETRDTDFMLATSMTDDRKHYAEFSKAYVSFPIAIATTVDTDYMADESALFGKRVAVGQGYSAYHILTKDNPGIEFVEVDNTRVGLQMLAANKVFAVVDNLPVLQQLIKEVKHNNIKVAGTTRHNIDLRLMVRSDYPQLTVIFNKAIDMISEQERKRILSRWLDPSEINDQSIVFTPAEQAWLAQDHTVRVRTFDWPPYMITRGSNPLEGIAVEYLKLIEKRSGIKFNYEKSSTSFAEFLANMKQRQGPDMTSLIVSSPDREEYFSFTESYVSSPYVIFARVEDDLILDINGLAGKVVAVPKGFIIQKKLTGDYPEIKLALFDSDEQCLNAVATGKADAYIGNLTVASHIIQKNGLTSLQVVAASPFGEQELSMGVRKDWPELTSIIDKALASITEKEKTTILKNYVSVQYKQGLEKVKVLKWALIFLAAMFGVISLFIVWNRGLKRRVHERTALLGNSEEKLRQSNERLRALAATLTRTEEQERRKIAAELHDHVGQSLAVMRIQLAAAKSESGGRKVGVMLDDVSESLREAIKDTRSIMSDLSSPTLNELGLSAAIADWLKEKIGDRHGLQTCFEDDGEPKPLNDDTSAIAFRSVRELLMNVIKHASASLVTVSIRKEGHMLKIIVADDGVGMPASIEREHKSDVRGFGLFSIMERMNDLDGSLSIESPPGQGVRAILAIPLEDAS